MHLKSQMGGWGRRGGGEKHIKVPLAVWMLNHTRRGGEWKTNEETQKCGTALNGVIHTAPEQSVVFINDMVPTLTGPGGELDTELKKT